MPSEFTEQYGPLILGILKESLFGETVIYAPASGAPFEITVLWSRTTDSTNAYCDLADFPTPPKKGDRLTRGATTWAVVNDPTSRDAQDEINGVRLELRQVAA